MTTPLQDEVRAEQASALKAMGLDENSKAAQLTVSIYDQIDALDRDGRDLLVTGCLSRVARGLHSFDPEDPMSSGVLRTLVAVAGYAIERNREDQEQFATGDRRTERIFETTRDAVKEVIRAQAPEAMQLAEDSAQAVQRRVEAGEDPNTVFEEELARLKEAAQKIAAEKGEKVEVPVAKATEVSTGQYL